MGYVQVANVAYVTDTPAITANVANTPAITADDVNTAPANATTTTRTMSTTGKLP